MSNTSKLFTLVSAGVLCTAFGLQAQQPEPGTTRRPGQQDTQPGQMRAENKFVAFDELKGASVHVKSPGSAGQPGQPGQTDRTGQTGSGSAENVGEIVDVVVQDTSGGMAGIGVAGRAEAVVKLNQKSGSDAGQPDQRSDAARSTGSGDRTVRVPLQMLDWDSSKKSVTFQRSREELDAMPVIVITVVELEPAGTGRTGQDQPGRTGQNDQPGRSGQDDPSGQQPGRGRPDEAAGRMTDRSEPMRLTNVQNASLHAKGGQEVGNVQKIVLDMNQGHAAFLLASTSSAGGGSLTVIPWSAVSAKDSGTADASAGSQKQSGQKKMTLVVEADQSELDKAPKIESGNLDKLVDPEVRKKLREAFEDSNSPVRDR